MLLCISFGFQSEPDGWMEQSLTLDGKKVYNRWNEDNHMEDLKLWNSPQPQRVPPPVRKYQFKENVCADQRAR
jgi:hypothetical protein